MLTEYIAWIFSRCPRARFRRSEKCVGASGEHNRSLRLACKRCGATPAEKMVLLDTHYDMVAAPSCDSPSKGQVDCSDNNADGFVLVNARPNSNKACE